MQSDDSFSYSYFPVIQFYDYGNEIKQKLSIGYGKELPIGSSLEIMYEENNPKRILILENNPQKKAIYHFYNCGYFFVNSRFNNMYSLKTYEMISWVFLLETFLDYPSIEEGRRDS